MKKFFSSAVIALLVVLVIGSMAFARGGGDANYGRKLTGETVEISGTIQAIDFTPPEIEIKVDVNGKGVEVELGPVWQYDSADFQIGASIALTGEYVTENVFLPYSLVVNNKTYELRDSDGYPLWAGKGKDDDNSRGYRNQDDQDEDWDCRRGRGSRNQDGYGRNMSENRGNRNR